MLNAAKKAQRGAPVSEILDYLQNWLKCSRIYFASYSLEFAKKSGRISCAAAFVGELMGLKPIITFEDGDSKILDKVRGEKSIVPAIVKLATQNMIPQTHYAIITGSVKEHGEELQAEMEKAVGYAPSLVAPAGAAISINAGPDVVACLLYTSESLPASSKLQASTSRTCPTRSLTILWELVLALALSSALPAALWRLPSAPPTTGSMRCV